MKVTATQSAHGREHSWTKESGKNAARSVLGTSRYSCVGKSGRSGAGTPSEQRKQPATNTNAGTTYHHHHRRHPFSSTGPMRTVLTYRCHVFISLLRLASILNRPQEDIGVKKQFQCDLSLAVESLRGVSLCATPMDKMLQVKVRKKKRRRR